MIKREDALIGCLLGGAVGDAIGLPCEKLRPARIAHLYGEVTSYHFAFGRGMISDDTEHASLTAVALVRSGGEPPAFGRALARGLRGWLLAVPPGAGLATLRASLKLCVGCSPERSGVFSAGNGPAMRAAILGAWCDDLEQLRTLNRVSTRLTHTDPKAERGAWLIALAAHLATRSNREANALLAAAQTDLSEDAELQTLLFAATQSAARGESTEEFARAQGWTKGVSGYITHTVPAALHACWRHPNDFGAAISGLVACGGDTDTVAAIAGGILGAGLGAMAIPPAWLDGLCDWPRSATYLEALGAALAQGEAVPALCWPALPARNALFVILVLGHAVRRMLPPY